MYEKLKKQRRSITLKIAAVLFAVWLIVSVIFSVITLTMEKQTQLTKQNNDFDVMIKRMTSMNTPTYNELCSYAEITKTHTDDITTKKLTPKITCGADGTFDADLQIVLFSYPTDKKRGKDILIDTDEEIHLSFKASEGELRGGGSGVVNYNEFVNTISQDSLDTIIEYLNIKKDKDGYYYALMCTQTYYDSHTGHMIPKTVSLVKTHDSHIWSAEDEVIKTFTLSPSNVEDMYLYTLAGDARCVIDGQFVCNNISSGNLIENPFEAIDYTTYDPDIGIVEKTGLFNYMYSNGETFTIDTLGYEASDLMIKYYEAEQNYHEDLANKILLNDEMDELIDSFENPIEYVQSDIGVRYAKRINLLECCSDTLIIGIISLFIFFLSIGAILTVMMYKVIKTQIIEEEKRIEITNSLAHDIKTPLFIISGYAQNLKDNVNTDKREHYCNRIINRTDEVNSLVHKMLDFSKLGTFERELNKESIDVEELVNTVIEDYYNLPETKNIKFAISKECVINADKALLKRAVSYLLDNAVRYSPENTDINVLIDNNSLSISNVCENISEHDLNHLTDAYFRVEKNRESKGNGLGLSIVKSIAEVHSFTLTITLKDNLITFTINFS